MGKEPVEEKAVKTDPFKLAASVEETMRSLTALMEKELAFLDKQDMAGLSSLREEKAKLLRAYQEHILTLRQTPSLLKGADEAARGRLREIGEKLAEVGQRNAAVLKAAIAGTQNFLQTVIEAAREGVKVVDSYADTRKKGGAKKAYSPTCSPIAVDRTA